MEKRLTRTDYVFALVFIFMLICALGSFFYGLRLGTDKTETKYQTLMKKNEEVATRFTAYDQTYLVSFYHTIYLPYKQFQTKWFKDMNEIEIQGGPSDPSSKIKDLGKLAEEKYNIMVTQSMLETSPLLKDAHQNYLKSLKLFSQAAKNFQSKANSLHGSTLMDEIEKDAFFAEAKTFSLQAQKGYYDSIVKWNESTEPEMKGLKLLNAASLPINDWSPLNINAKNDIVSGFLLTGKVFKPFTPQDLVIHIDEIIKSGQAKKLNLTTIQQIAELLINTGAVRQGDFINGKSKWYNQEPLPQLPFFLSAS